MRPLVLTFGLLAAACLSAAAQEQEHCTVEGRVVKSGVGEPLSRAKVILRKADARNVSYSASSGEDGRFVISNVQPGRYRLSAERNGYVRAAYGQRRANQAGSVLTLEPGQKAGDIVLNMIPFAVITGRVVDEDGEPVPHVRVSAQRPVFQNGRRRLAPAAGAGSDDRGEYRIFGLPPGKYFVSAAPSRGPMAQDGDNEQYVPVYYPGVTEPGQAAPLEMQPGSELNGVDFRLARMPTVRVRGRVTSEAGTRPERGMAVFLMPRGDNFSALNAVVAPDGTFEIRGVVPGSYVLTAFQSDRQHRLFARLPVEVGASTVEGIHLVLTPGMEVTGRVRFEEGEGKVEGLRVMMQARGGGGIGGSGGVAPVQSDGTFTCRNIAVDSYDFSVLGLSGDAYLKAVRLGGTNVLARGVDLTGGDAPSALDVVLSSAGARVEGSVLNGKQQPAAGATVVLVPEPELRSRSDLYRSATADDSGRFTIQGIPPGNYRLLAWEDIEPGSWLDPDFLRDYERSGETISISERARLNPRIKVIQAGSTTN